MISSGCVLQPRYDMDTVDKALLTTAIGLQIADYYTTKRAFDDGFYERNVLYGREPSNEKLISLKLLGIGLTYFFF